MLVSAIWESESATCIHIPPPFGFPSHLGHHRARDCHTGFPGGASGKELTSQCRRHTDGCSIPGLGGSLEEGIATDSSILAWITPWAEEPGWLQSTESQSQTLLK